MSGLVCCVNKNRCFDRWEEYIRVRDALPPGTIDLDNADAADSPRRRSRSTRTRTHRPVEPIGISDNTVPSRSRPNPLREKRNQKCWLCEQRRSCILAERGWECRTCRKIR
ncbi:hypothetical protein AWN90_42055 [Nocardia terpenica]|uniref:Uncharacterized protein n=1 Tax=Nocardia terpenica TaxID=455432 RepID=A0A164K6X4_9NOCA|nr:hypothetical protein AWN90_42055 [Nocardia terpenica]